MDADEFKCPVPSAMDDYDKLRRRRGEGMHTPLSKMTAITPSENVSPATETLAIPPDCRIRIEVYAPGNAIGDILTAAFVMARPEAARAVHAGKIPYADAYGMFTRLSAKPGMHLGISWADMAGASPDDLRAAALPLASRLAFLLGDDVTEVALHEFPCVGQWWPFWAEPVTPNEEPPR